MKHLISLLLFLSLAGCSHVGDADLSAVEDVGAPPKAESTKKDDSTACAYWKCSTTKKMYMQKYVKNDGGKYRPDGAYKLGEGIGAFPLEDLGKYGSDGQNVSWNVGIDPCPHCGNKGVGQCPCQKIHCCKGMHATCPWCGRENDYTPGEVNVGGGG
ncbi:MAG: hypothetical protein LBT89_10700 [Planctomycetaceae bacterium]|jgi:hypothetical protein|nr:hypothetical protein [Planctomycetaceae bacterium]